MNFSQKLIFFQPMHFNLFFSPRVCPFSTTIRVKGRYDLFDEKNIRELHLTIRFKANVLGYTRENGRYFHG